MNNGFILIHRKLLDNPIWTCCTESTLRVWLACLVLANWRDGSWYDGHQEVQIPRGSFVSGREKLAAVCHVSEKQIRTALVALEKLQCLAIKRTNKYSVITVTKYNDYQFDTDQEGQQEGQQRASRGPAEGQQRATTEYLNKETREEEHSCAIGIAPEFALQPDDSRSGKTGKRPKPVFYDECFHDWYNSYWRRKSPDTARKAYERAINRLVDIEHMGYRQAQIFLQQQTIRDKARFEHTEEWRSRSRMMPSTWLNQRRWTDDDEPENVVIMRKPMQTPTQLAKAKALEEERRNGITAQSN